MYIVVRTEGKHNMGYGCVCVLECLFDSCACVCKLVIKYDDVMKVSRIHTCTSKTVKLFMLWSCSKGSGGAPS